MNILIYNMIIFTNACYCKPISLFPVIREVMELIYSNNLKYRKANKLTLKGCPNFGAKDAKLVSLPLLLKYGSSP